jgi:formate/nitrite transporter
MAATAPGAFPARAPYTPEQIAQRVEMIGCAKAELAALPTFVLGLLAGAFIAFGAMLYTAVVTGTDAGYGPARLLGGIAFSLGLVLVIVGGAELFTGNNLLVMAWAERKVSTARLLRNWAIVYVANFIGAVGAAVLVDGSGTLAIGDGAVGRTAIAIAEAKLALPPWQAFLRGLLCNALVCLAVWLCFAAHDVAGKVLAIVFPIAAFVALGFEHSVANMYLVPVAMLAGAPGLDLAGFLGNLAFVTLGNVVGGSLFVAVVYWAVYLRGAADR